MTLDPPTTLLDTRVPQPGRWEDYQVPDWAIKAAESLFRARNSCNDEDVPGIDAALLRLLQPWTRSGLKFSFRPRDVGFDLRLHSQELQVPSGVQPDQVIEVIWGDGGRCVGTLVQCGQALRLAGFRVSPQWFAGT